MLYGEAEIRETVDALENREQPAVPVSLEQLQNFLLSPWQFNKRYNRVYFLDANSYAEAARLNPYYAVRSPYDEWDVNIQKPPHETGDDLRPKRNINELLRAVQPIDWLPYIMTAFLQWEPGKFLEYLRLIQSTKNNPWVEPVFYGNNAPSKRFKWADTLTGTEYDISHGYPPLAMYPHTRTEDGQLDMSITVDRFIETVIYEALGEAFTILDIARTTDLTFLEHCYSAVLNRSQYVKSQIGENSVVRVYESAAPKNNLVRTFSVSLNPDLQAMFKRAVDDALVLIRQNRDKLAARAIEVRDILSRNVETTFVGPKWLDPLVPAATDLTLSELEKKISVRRVAVRTNTTSQFAKLPPVIQVVPADAVGSVPAAKKKNYLLPVAGVAAAALGIYAATR